MTAKGFGKKVKSFFWDKGLQTNNIILKGKNRLVTDSLIIANTFNSWFINITNIFNLKPYMPKSKTARRSFWRLKNQRKI